MNIAEFFHVCVVCVLQNFIYVILEFGAEKNIFTRRWRISLIYILHMSWDYSVNIFDIVHGKKCTMQTVQSVVRLLFRWSLCLNGLPKPCNSCPSEAISILLQISITWHNYAKCEDPSRCGCPGPRN